MEDPNNTFNLLVSVQYSKFGLDRVSFETFTILNNNNNSNNGGGRTNFLV